MTESVLPVPVPGFHGEFTISPAMPGTFTGGAIAVWGGGNPGTLAWPAANRALGYPFQVMVPCTIYKVWYGAGGTAGGNLDIGLYDSAGNRLFSTGATARTASVHTAIDVTDYVLSPGFLYYAAMAVDSTANMSGWAPAVVIGATCGIVEAAASYTLPNPITWARAESAAAVPNFGFTLRSTDL